MLRGCPSSKISQMGRTPPHFRHIGGFGNQKCVKDVLIKKGLGVILLKFPKLSVKPCFWPSDLKADFFNENLPLESKMYLWVRVVTNSGLDEPFFLQ